MKHENEKKYYKNITTIETVTPKSRRSGSVFKVFTIKGMVG
jgi:hypothetical protein